MKKLTLYNIVNIIFLAGFITLLCVQRYLPFTDLEMKDFWFPVLCMTIGISLIIKAIIFKSDSSTWFGSILVFNGAVLFASYYTPYNYFTLWPTLFSSVAFASLMVGIFFRDWIHYKIASFLVIISVSFYLYAFKIINFWWFLGAFFITLIVAVFVGGLVPERIYMNKKEK